MSALADFALALRDPTQPPPVALGATAARFDVHRNTRMCALLDALADSYPVSRALVGDECLRGLARACVLHAPPRTPVMTEYVQVFPAFIARFAPAQSMPWLHDVATLEALRLASAHAADAVPLGTDALAPWLHTPDALARARVQLHPAARWFRARHAAHALWSAHATHDDPAHVDLSGIDVGLAEDVLITRPWLDVVVSRASPGLCALLDALAAGDVLGEAMACALTDAPGVDPAHLFSTVITSGLLVAIAPGP